MFDATGEMKNRLGCFEVYGLTRPSIGEELTKARSVDNGLI